jgi:hypothetical protein
MLISWYIIGRRPRMSTGRDEIDKHDGREAAFCAPIGVCRVLLAGNRFASWPVQGIEPPVRRHARKASDSDHEWTREAKVHGPIPRGESLSARTACRSSAFPRRHRACRITTSDPHAAGKGDRNGNRKHGFAGSLDITGLLSWPKVAGRPFAQQLFQPLGQGHRP